jgi:hypothetical protein
MLYTTGAQEAPRRSKKMTTTEEKIRALSAKIERMAAEPIKNKNIGLARAQIFYALLEIRMGVPEMAERRIDIINIYLRWGESA